MGERPWKAAPRPWLGCGTYADGMRPYALRLRTCRTAATSRSSPDVSVVRLGAEVLQVCCIRPVSGATPASGQIGARVDPPEHLLDERAPGTRPRHPDASGRRQSAPSAALGSRRDGGRRDSTNPAARGALEDRPQLTPLHPPPSLLGGGARIRTRGPGLKSGCKGSSWTAEARSAALAWRRALAGRSARERPARGRRPAAPTAGAAPAR